MPCIVTYNGKEYSEAEFFAFLAKGELDNLIKAGLYKPTGALAEKVDKQAKAELETEVKQLEKAYNEADSRYQKAKQSFDKASKESQINLMGESEGDTKLFKPDLSQMNKKVKELLEQRDKAKQDFEKAQKRLSDYDSVKQAKLPTGGYASTAKGGTLTDLKKQANQVQKPYMNAFDAVKQALKEIGVPIAEGYLPKSVRGLYKTKPKKVRVHSLWQIGTVTHEVAHWISDKFGIGAAIRNDSAIAGTNPDAAFNKKVREELSKIYLKYYPKSKPDDSLEKTIEEGIAVLLQQYFYDPDLISREYPFLVDTFISPTGKYYNTKFTETLEKTNKIVSDYSDLSDGDKIGARTADRSKRIMQEDKKGFTWAQWIEFQMATRSLPLRMIDKMYGSGLTDESAEIAYRRWQTRGHIAATWITGSQTPMTVDKNGNWRKLKYSMKDLANVIKGKEKEFDYYLISRRVVGDVNYLHELQNELADLMQSFDPDTATKEEIEEIEALNQKINKQTKLIEKDNFDIQAATNFLNEYDKQFEIASEIYDYINTEVARFAYETGRLSKEKFESYEKNPSYAAFRRITEDDFATDMPMTSGGGQQSQVSSFKTRTGSMKQIISPVYSQMFYISEVINKGMQNQVWSKLAEIAENDEFVAKNYFEPMATEEATNKDTGMISYPQMNDKNLVPVWKNGKPTFYKANKPLLAMAETMRPQELHTALYLAKYATNIFSRLTTSANPLFPLVNLPVDTISAWMNTKAGFKPVVSQAKSLVDLGKFAFEEFFGKIENVSKWYDRIRAKPIKSLSKEDQSLFAKYLALGGSTQTLSGYYEMSPDEMIAAIRGDSKLKRAVKNIDTFTLGILEFPSNTSEYLTRFAEFKRAKEKGFSDDVAMYMASEVSVPFIQQGYFGGKFGQEFVRTIPYMNASIQVMAKFIKTSKENPAQVALVGGAIAALTISMALMTMALSDDDDIRALASQEPEDLSKFIYIPNAIGGGKGFTKIRVPEQIGWIGAVSTMAIMQQHQNIKYNMGDYRRAVTAQVPRQFNVFEPTQALLSLQPQIVRPTYEVITNTRAYPTIRNIVPDFMRKKLPEYQYDEYTSETAKFIGKYMNASPKLVDYFIKSQFGKVPSAAIDIMESIYFDRERKTAKSLTQIESKEFITRGRNMEEFYKNLTYWRQVKGSKKNILEPQDYSEEDKIHLLQSAYQYEIMENIVSDIHDMTKDGVAIPESIQKKLFSVIQDINEAEKPYIIADKIEALSSSVTDWMQGIK